MDDEHHDESRPPPQPWLSTQSLQNAVNFARIELACEEMGSIICALFVVDWFSFESVAIRKRRNVLSCAGRKSLKPAIAHDAGVAG